MAAMAVDSRAQDRYTFVGRGHCIEHRLLTGEHALQTVRCRISGMLLGLAVLGGLAFRVDCRVSAWTDSGVSWFLSAASIVLLSLLPLPEDAPVTRVVLGILVADPTILLAIVCFQLLSETASARCRGETQSACSTSAWRRAGGAYSFEPLLCHHFLISFQLVLMVGVTLARLRRRVSSAQALMWGIVKLYFLIELVTDLVLLAADPAGTVRWIPGDLLGVWFAMSPATRHSVQAHVSRVCSERGQKAAAASIAGFMSGFPVHDVLQEAEKRFRCVPANLLRYEDFVTSPTQLSELACLDRTMPARLGDVDAFLSHSWHDSVEAKWQALQEWRAAFVAEHGREPRVWFDKLCINQADIEADLRGLPIFLSGCRELLVLCGPTYLSRLWCIMELFTFVQMGGDIRRIKLARLLRNGQRESDVAAIQQASEDFDVRRCNCLVSADKEKMLDIVMASFGNVAGFNEAVNALMKHASPDDEERVRTCKAVGEEQPAAGGAEDTGGGCTMHSPDA